MVNFGPLAAESFGSLGHLSYFQRPPRLGSVTAQHVLVGVSQTLWRWTERPSRWALAHISSSKYFWTTKMLNMIDYYGYLFVIVSITVYSFNWLNRVIILWCASSVMMRNVLWSRVSVCLSAATCLHYCTHPDVTWGSGRRCPLVVHYWADLQSVHRLTCYGNIMQNVSKYMLVLAICLVLRIEVLEYAYLICSLLVYELTDLHLVLL